MSANERSDKAGGAPAPATGKLVFGLNARANRVKYDEYAEQRLKSCLAGEEKAKELQQQQQRRVADRENSPASKQPVMKGGRGGGAGAQSEPVVGQQRVARLHKSANLSTESDAGRQQIVGQTGPSNKCDELVGAGPSVKQQVEGRARSKSPAKQPAKVVRRKSVEERQRRAESAASGGGGGAHSANEDTNQRQQTVKARAQFNVLPPPQLAMATTGRGSVVSYAKSRIYDKPSRPILSNPPLVLQSLDDTQSAYEAAAAAAAAPSSLIFNVGHIPQSILSGRKPPKQVNVSKARKEWEGGEPFAKCRSRKRLAQVQRNQNKLLIHESWSMASVVATQQLQLQQALQAAQTARRSSYNQSDPSVKVLTRGSVLERVQQYERAPSASSLASLSGSSSSSSLLDDDDDDDGGGEQANSDDEKTAVGGEKAEAELTIGSERQPAELAGKQAAYRHRVCKIQLSQQQQQRDARTPAGPAAGASQRRRLSFARRRSSSISSSKQSGHLIPKFYHPQGNKPNTYEIELEKRNIVAAFERLPERRAQLAGPNARRHFHSLALACGFSEYYKIPLLLYVKHQLETRPELRETGGLPGAPNGSLHYKAAAAAASPSGPGAYGSLARRRASIAQAPMNPNNVPAAQPARNSRALARSNSQQQQQLGANSVTGTRGEDLSNGLEKAQSTTNGQERTTNEPAKLQKSASVDAANGDAQSNQPAALVSVDCDQFLLCWKHLISSAYDTAAKFTHLLTLGQRDHLLPDDFVPLMQSIIDDHPGLKFLRAAPDFHMRYIQTVIARIYYCVNKSWTGKIKLQELRRSNFLAVLQVLAQEEDINQITDYFSYEHFYVIYCKFWSLDQDHDLLISKEDLARHNDASISSRIIDRIFSGIVSKQIGKSGKMSYSDFVCFIIAEEDKKHPRSVEYWFRLMDLDGDGYISMYELEYFYYEQMKRLELMNIEALPFLDTACQMLDLVNPREKNKISLADLKRTKMAAIFLDTFINLEKYLEHESREFVSARDTVQDGVIISDWDRYASEEYENMVTEESSV